MIYVTYETKPDFPPPYPWRAHATPCHVIYWVGHLFYSGLPAGFPSIDRLGRDLQHRTLAKVAIDLHGVFGLLVFDKERSTWSAMVDNAGLYKLYRDGRGIGASFLDIAGRQGSRLHIAKPVLVEYLAQREIYGGATLVDGIYKIRLTEIAEIVGPSHIDVRAKELPRWADYDDTLFMSHFRDLLLSCEGRRLSIDITGGYDTRLIVAILDSLGANYELAVSGWAGAKDVQIAQEIGACLGRPVFVTEHRWTNLEEELITFFEEADGQLDPVHFHRDRMNARARLDRGVEVVAHGGAGGHYKDYFFLQDLPFYGSKRVNFEKFYDLRITPVRLPTNQLTLEARALVDEARRRSIARFEEHRAATNNESYDRAAFFVCDSESFGGHLAVYTNMGLGMLAPFLDYRNMLMCFRIPPWERFMTGWHRQRITKVNPAIARIRTTENYTASALPEDRIGNVLGYIGPQVRRVAKKVAQRAFGKSLFFKIGAPACDHPEFRPAVKRTSLFAEAIERLKEFGVLAPEVHPEDVRDHHVPAMLNAGLLLRTLARGVEQADATSAKEAAG